MESSDKMLYDGRIQLRLGPGPSKLIHLLGMPTLSGCTTEDVSVLMEDEAWVSMLEDECLENGVRVLGILPPNYRVVTSDQPIGSASEFRDIRMRYTGSVYSETIWEPLGCEMIKVDLASTAAALNSRFVDAWTIIHCFTSSPFSVIICRSMCYRRNSRYI